jgi:hypothetical protein
MNRPQRAVTGAVCVLLSGVFVLVFLVQPYREYVKLSRQARDFLGGIFVPSFEIGDHAFLGIVVPILLLGLGAFVYFGGAPGSESGAPGSKSGAPGSEKGSPGSQGPRAEEVSR